MIVLIKKEEVWNAIGKIKNNKAVGPDGILVEVWRVLGNVGIIWLTRQSLLIR